MSTKEDLLLAEIADLREQLYRAENPAFNGRLDSWQAACGKARGESESLRNELRELKAENERLEREAKKDLIAYKAVIERQNELRAENAGLKTGYQAYERVNAELKAESERIERNRDMWKGQVERQAEELTSLRKDAERYRSLRKATPYRFKKMQDAALTDGGDVMYFHSDRFDAAVDAAMGKGEQS